MKFTTLILIASAVLALPTGENADHSKVLAKKDASPYNDYQYSNDAEEESDGRGPGGLIYPTEDENDPNSEKNRANQEESPLKNKKDNNGTPCRNYFDSEVKDVPEECMKSVFCRESLAYKIGNCSEIKSLNKDNWTKQKLLDEEVTEQCVDVYICTFDEYYRAD